MNQSSESPVQRVVRKFAQTAFDAGAAEGELLRRFVVEGDERAFDVLVRRHGPMVLRLCVRILQNRQDAEDAFQAAFLVLARKASSLRTEGSLAAWLHGVAYRAAHKARIAAARRRKHERCCPERTTRDDHPAEMTLREAHEILHQELLHLPDKLRTPLVLCYLEGLTRDEAARRLGWSTNLVKSRLEQGRDRLRLRLARRGLALSGTLVALLFDEAPAGAAGPGVLVTPTTRAAGGAADGAAALASLGVSPNVVALTRGVVKPMLLTKSKVVTCAIVLTTAAALCCYQALADMQDKFGGGKISGHAANAAPIQERQSAGADAPGDAAVKKVLDPTQVTQPRSVSDQDKLQGTWRIVELIVDGQPARRQNPTEEADMVVEGDKMSLVALPEGEKVKEFRFKIDPAKMPKAIDLAVPTELAKGKTGHGIYELEGDQWRLCFPQDPNEAKERPTSFKSEAGSRLVLMTLKRKVEPKTKDKGNASKEPAWKAEFRKKYGLSEGELIRRVAPPYPACRAEYFEDLVRQVYERTKQSLPKADDDVWEHANYFTTFRWQDGWPAPELTVQVAPIVPNDGVSLRQLLHMVTGFRHTRTEGDAELLARKVTGDFVVRAGAAPEKVVAALQKMLREGDLPAALRVEETERDVYVLSGNYEAKPLGGRKQNQIEVYGFMLTDRNTGGGGSGSVQEMIDHIEAFIEVPIAVGAITGAPKEVEWHFNSRSPFTAAQRMQDHDPESVLRNITAQTGLRVLLQKRKIKNLVVEQSR